MRSIGWARAVTVTACCALTALPAAAFGAPAADATAPVGAQSIVLAEQTVGGQNYIISEITLAPGGSTGWHTHRNTVYGIVKSGVLTHYGADCRQDGVFGPEAALADPAGADHPHIGRNMGTEPVVLQVTYVVSAGDPLSDDAGNPGCGFA